MEDKQIISNGKILFLHGFTQNSELFSGRIKVLINHITKNLKLDYLIPDAPFIIKDAIKSNDVQRGWCYLNEDDKISNENFLNADNVRFIGIEKSFEMIKDLVIKEKISCVFSFSQGCLINMLLSALKEEGESKHLLSNLKCVVYAAGFAKPYMDNYPEYIKYFTKEKQMTIPSLHIYGKADEFIQPFRSERLVECYEDPIIYIHEGKHCVPSKKPDLEIISTFLKKYH